MPHTQHLLSYLSGVCHLSLHEGRGLVGSSQLCLQGIKNIVGAHYSLMKGMKLSIVLGNCDLIIHPNPSITYSNSRREAGSSPPAGSPQYPQLLGWRHGWENAYSVGVASGPMGSGHSPLLLKVTSNMAKLAQLPSRLPRTAPPLPSPKTVFHRIES